MRPWARGASLAVTAIAAVACQPGGDDEAFGRRVHAYLLRHPEVLQEMSERLDLKQAAADEAGRRHAEAMLPRLRDRIERDPADFVANPGGRITLTEFYDYRCPHCANAAPKVLDLIRRRPDVRVVFKESPIFGAVSEHAARAALAVRKAGGDSLGLYQTFMSARGLDDADIDRLARQKGARPEDLKPGGTAEQNAQLQRNAALFGELDLQGTPAFIVGDRIILGEDMNAVETALSARRP